MMADDLIVAGMVIPGSEIEETFHTSGGPGGQHANRSETAVRLRFNIEDSSLPQDVKNRLVARLGEVVEVAASEERSQLRNRETARRRLAERLETGMARRKKRKKTRRSRASEERRLKKKRERADNKRLRRKPRLED